MDKVFLPFYYSWRDKTKNLSDEEFGKLTRAILLYSETGELTSGFSDLGEMAYEFIIDVIKRSQKRADEGRKAAYKRWNNSQSNSDLIGSQYQPNTINTNINTNNNNNYNNDMCSSACTRENIEFEVIKFFNKHHFISSVEDFIAYNKARDWKGYGGEDILIDWERYAWKWETEEHRRQGDNDWRPPFDL